jgi:membrane-associated phospholipid phosphatase
VRRGTLPQARGYAGRVTRRPTIPLLIALACALAMGVIALLALGSPGVHERDAALLHGFVALDRPAVHDAVDLVAHLADPAPYALAGLALAGVALLRGLRRRAVAVTALLVVAGASTQAVKQLLAQPRFEAWLGAQQVGEASWPSGHATAAMTLALCAVLVAPPALRLAVALAGAAFAAGVGYAVLVLAWHFPSDVLGAYLMAAMWTALAVAALRLVEDEPIRSAGVAPVGWREGAGLAVAAAAVAGLAVLALPGEAIALYAAERPTLAAGALVIAALAAALPAGLARTT